MLIQWAYDIDDDRLSGAPKWLGDDHFDIVAKSPDAKPPVGQFQTMMRSLLKDRFHLTFHNERRELTSYSLVIDKTIPKVHVVDATGGFPSSPFSMTDPGRLTGTKVTAAMLAKVLSEQLKRPVQDMTGFKEAFEFTLEWAPATVAESADFRNRPSIFTAVREQLGFRLDARKAPVDVLVIDGIERSPSAN